MTTTTLMAELVHTGKRTFVRLGVNDQAMELDPRRARELAQRLSELADLVEKVRELAGDGASSPTPAPDDEYVIVDSFTPGPRPFRA